MGRHRKKDSAITSKPAKSVEDDSIENTGLEGAMENAKDKVVDTLSSAQQKKNADKLWSDRPDHLRKPLAEMSDKDKCDYYLWKAEQFVPEKSTIKIVSDEMPQQESYTADDFKLLVMGANFFIQKRWGDFYALDGNEINNWCEAFVPIANKFMALPEWALVFKPLMACAGAYAGKRFMMKIFSNALGNNVDSGNVGNGQNYAHTPAASTIETSSGNIAV